MEDGIDGVKNPEDGLREGLTSLGVDCHEHRENACLPENNVLTSALMDEDSNDQPQRLFASIMGPPAIENIGLVETLTWAALSSNIKRGGVMAARARPAAATGSARGEKHPRSTSSRGSTRGECFTFRDQGCCTFGANSKFQPVDHQEP